ncbi:MAG TPA: GNAT family N-acetyltransferase [Gaiellaceae bacterium]|nr:GNAT family N-acetyltransferase [Gaiellaceae bacterium]
MTPDRLRAIAAAAKGHWGYDAQLVAGWAAEMALPDEPILAERDGIVVGWASVERRGDVLWLEDLWVEPAAMGQGVGRELFERARALGAGCGRMEWEADPNAVPFYERMGASYVRDSDPSEWGRVLPVMAISLAV